MPEDNIKKNHEKLPSSRWFRFSFALSAILWLAVLGWWFTYKPPFQITERVPGECGEPAQSAVQSAVSSNIGEFFSEYDGVPSSVSGSWPRFRGSKFDNINIDKTPLRDFSDGTQPTVLWSVVLGEGHAAPAVHNGRVYVLDYDEEKAEDALRVFSLDDGKEIWRRSYSNRVRRNHGMSRTVPAVTDSVVVTIGPRCHVMAAHAVTGDFLWGIDLVKEYGTEEPLWYTGQCPLIDDTVAVIAPAGSKALLIGVHKTTGEVLWETPNKHNWKMSHSSVMPMKFGGRSIYVYCAAGGIAGVAADGDDRGSILFETSDFNWSVVAPSPVVLNDGRIFMTAGYGGGSIILQVSHNDGIFSISTAERHTPREAMASEQQTPIYYGGHLYAVLPKDAGTNREQFVCVDEKDVSSFKWTSGPENRFGLGPFLIADNKFFILSDDGTLTVATVSNRRFEKKASIKIMDGIDAWGPMAIVSGRLLLRDSKRMFCIDLRR
jgi:outer membrane protein assembly factor BamB